jgi:hypothetical protein
LASWVALANIPRIACVILIATYLYCIIYGSAAGTFIGDIPFPYFSDTGRDPPSYYVFATFLTIVGILLASTHILLHFAWLRPVINKLQSEGKTVTNTKTYHDKCCSCCSIMGEATAAMVLSVAATPL